MRLKNVLIVTEDIERSKKFYKDLFGLEVIFDYLIFSTDKLHLHRRSNFNQIAVRIVKPDNFLPPGMLH